MTNTAPSNVPVEDNFPVGVIPTTNASDVGYIVESVDEEYTSNLEHGHVILNQACTLLSRTDHEIVPYKNQKNFIQRIASTTLGSSIPLLYPEAMLFPSKFWYMDSQSCSFPGV